jgi:hypothetical protein
MEPTLDWPVEGVLVHVAGQTAKGFRVVDGAPEIYETHAFVSA